MSDGNVIVVPPFEDNAEEAELRKALQQSDNEAVAEQTREEKAPEAPKDEADKSESQSDEEQEKSDSSESKAERDELGRFKAKEATVEKEEVKPLAEGEPEAQPPVVDKEQQRLAKSWQKIQSEKTEVRNALQEIRQLKDQLAQQLQQRPAEQPRFTSKQYMGAADEFERQAAALMSEGDVEQAKSKLELARQSRTAGHQFAQQEQVEAQQQQSTNFQNEWQRHAEVAIQQHPELGDPQSEQAQAMMELLEDYPILGYIPDGFKKGVEILGLRKDAASASELRAENSKLKAEVKELREKTAITGGGLTGKISPKDFDSMGLDEMEKSLRSQLYREDFGNS